MRSRAVSLPLGVLGGDPLFAAAKAGALASSVEAGQDVLHQEIRKSGCLAA